MMMYRAYKFRMYPNVNQTRELGTMLETCRRIYNKALADRKEAYEKEGRTLRLADQYPIFAAERNKQIGAKKAGEPGQFWYAQVPSVALRDTIVRLDKGFDAFFRKLQNGQKSGYPRFRSRDRYSSIPFDNCRAGCALVNYQAKPIFGDMQEGQQTGVRVRLKGVGSIRVKIHRLIEGTIKTICLKREAEKWYAVLIANLGEVKIDPSALPPVGIDVGLESFLTTSNGEQVETPRFLEADQPELRRSQRSLSRKKKGGSNRRKARRRVAKHHARIRNQRKAHHHKTALKLVRRYGFIAVERLNVQWMLKNHRLARAIGDAAWGSFLAILKCKAESAGVRVEEVDPRGTSQECSGCGKEVRKELSVRMHTCPHCSLTLHRDENAARVILSRGMIQARIGPAEGNVAGCRKRSPRKVLP